MIIDLAETFLRTIIKFLHNIFYANTIQIFHFSLTFALIVLRISNFYKISFTVDFKNLRSFYAMVALPETDLIFAALKSLACCNDQMTFFKANKSKRVKY